MNSVIIGAVIAVLGWMVAHFSKLHFEKRAAQLCRVNNQLEKLYGPLMATLIATDETWVAFRAKHWPKHGMDGYFGSGADNLSEEELSRWRTWIVNVFHPLNEQIESTIIGNIHLIEGEKIPKSFTTALSHISAYRAIISQWNAGNFTEHVSVNNWPAKELMDSVEPVFRKLSRDQSELLGDRRSSL